MEQSHEQSRFWEQFENDVDRRMVSDVCGGIRRITDDKIGDPAELIAMGIAGAEAAEGVSAGMETQWALYTPPSTPPW
ncbi:hypothetical protein [Streptomyces sp. NPDC015345]|uniref:hypothetical protein n=1 Tax=Streptomyces sp. NPDC015345 TaxID=3364953 RepID=UPI0036F9B74C